MNLRETAITASHASQAAMKPHNTGANTGSSTGARPGGRGFEPEFEPEFDFERVIFDPEYRAKVRDALNRGVRSPRR